MARQSVIRKMQLAMIGFGLAMGIIFPLYASLFVNFKPGMLAMFVVGCILAGLFVGGFSVFLVRITLLKFVTRASDELQLLSQGEADLRYRFPQNGNDAIGRMSHWFNQFMQTLESIISQVKINIGSSRQMTDAIHENSQSIVASSGEQQDILKRVDSSVAGMQQVLASTQQLIADAASQADVVADQTRSSLGSLESFLAAAVQMVDRLNVMGAELNELNKKSESIGGLVQNIDDIAEQTRLLALNASIEAARAGEAGRGFAVVAAEVGNLAEKSSRVTTTTKEEMAAIVQSIQNATAGVASMQEESGQQRTIAGSTQEAMNRMEQDIEALKSLISLLVQEAETSRTDTLSIGQDISRTVALSDVSAQAAAVMEQTIDRLAEAMGSLEQQVSGFVTAS